MKALMTEELAEGLPPLYATEGEGEPMALVYYFSCLSGWDWCLTEYDPEPGEAFGIVRGLETEWGYLSGAIEGRQPFWHLFRAARDLKALPFLSPGQK